MKSLVQLFQYLLIIIASVAAVSLAQQFPFYFSWDMDLTVIQDLLLLQDSQLPAHFAHPGLGMNYLLYLLQSLAQFFGLITEVNMTTLANAYQPLLVVAEQVSFLRTLNALFCVFLVVTLWKALESLMRPSQINSTLLLISCLSIPSIWKYNTTLIRTETYSLIFWAIAVFFTVLAARERVVQLRIRTIYLIGLFSAFSFFTKIQSFFLVAMIPVLYFYWRRDEDIALELAQFAVKKFLWIFLGIGVLTIILPFPNYIAVFKSNWLPNKFFVVFIFLLYFMHSVQAEKKWVLKWKSMLREWFEFLAPFLKGASLVLVIPLFLPLNIFTSLYNVLLTFKVIFLRHSQFSDFGQFSILSNFAGIVQHNWIYFVLLIMILAHSIWKFRTNKNYKVFYYFLALCALMCLHFLFGVRDKMQDRVWLEVPVLVLVLGSLYDATKTSQRVALSIFILIQFGVLTHFAKFKSPSDVAYFDPGMFFNEVYRFNQYKPIFDRKYNSVESSIDGVRFAASWAFWKSDLANHFPDSNFNLMDIEPFENGFLINSKETSDLSFVFAPDREFSILTMLKSKEKIRILDCKILSETKIVVNQIEYLRLFVGGSKIDKWTGRLMPATCRFENLDPNTLIVLKPAF